MILRKVRLYVFIFLKNPLVKRGNTTRPFIYRVSVSGK
nr:MAG TPA: hypothetical protein [Caudoviricetes sp.]